jgi:hypothetical protein
MSRKTTLTGYCEQVRQLIMGPNRCRRSDNTNSTVVPSKAYHNFLSLKVKQLNLTSTKSVVHTEMFISLRMYIMLVSVIIQCVRKVAVLSGYGR